MLDRVEDWAACLAGGLSDEERQSLQSGERTGRPLGLAAFVEDVERRLGRTLARQAPGRKPGVKK
jgi:putative transposase